MTKAFSLTLNYLGFNLMSAMEYRGAFLLQMFGMALNDVAMLFFWGVFYTMFGALNGWALHDVLTLYAMVAANYAIGNIIFGNCFSLGRIIATGGLDYYLALPASPLLHVLVSHMEVPAWGDLLFGIVLFAVLWGANPAAWLLFLMGAIVGTLALVAFAIVLGSLAFFLGNADSLSGLGINAITTFSMYPIDLFPLALRLLLYTLIPAAFLSSIPATLVRDFDWTVLLAYAAGGVALVLGARWVFYRGLRRYESGNLVVARM
jgi:ABC-2 type transport system permease protein